MSMKQIPATEKMVCDECESEVHDPVRFGIAIVDGATIEGKGLDFCDYECMGFYIAYAVREVVLDD